jgi:hypothetical protein
MTSVTLALAILGSDPATTWVQANAAFDAGTYEQACRGFAEVAAATASGHAYYNLGNCHLRAGQVGASIAALREAEALLPRDADVRANLAYARSETVDKIAPATNGPWQTLLFWYRALSLRELVVCAVLANALLWMLLTLLVARPHQDGARLGAAVVGFFALVLGGSVSGRVVFPERVAVVTQTTISVHSALSRDSVVRFELHEGAELTWSEERDQWVRIHLADGKQGWVAREDVATLRL